MVGNPLPDEAPNSDWLTAEISTDTLLSILAIVLWLAWLHFVICLLVEFRSDRRGRGLAPHVPGGGVGTQALARRLVGAVLLLAGASAATLPSATATGDRAPDQTTASAQAALTAAAPGEASRRAVPTTAPIRNVDGVVKYYEVQPSSGRHYDTLWDIAERFLGSGLRYKEIFELNHGVLQPDGRKLTNADLIQPGWQLQLPADAEGASLKIVDHRVSDPTRPAPAAEPQDGQPSESPQQSQPVESHPVESMSAVDAEPPTPGEAPTEPEETSEPPNQTSELARDEPRDDAESRDDPDPADTAESAEDPEPTEEPAPAWDAEQEARAESRGEEADESQ